MFKFKNEIMSIVKIFENEMGLIIEVSNRYIKLEKETMEIHDRDEFVADLLYVKAIRDTMDNNAMYPHAPEVLEMCDKIERYVIANS